MKEKKINDILNDFKIMLMNYDACCEMLGQLKYQDKKCKEEEKDIEKKDCYVDLIDIWAKKSLEQEKKILIYLKHILENENI